MMKLREYLDQNWGRDAGHAISGILLTVLAYAGNGLILPALVGALAFGAVARFLAKVPWWSAAAVAGAVFLGLLLAPAGPLWAALIGGTAYMLPKEAADIARWGFRLDNLSDAASYQFGTPLMLALFYGVGLGASNLLGLVVFYLALVFWKTR